MTSNDASKLRHTPSDGKNVLWYLAQFLFNRYSYSNLLTQGHLYFRSWNELQYQVLGSVPEGQNPILAGGPPEVVHHLPRINPVERTPSQSEDER